MSKKTEEKDVVFDANRPALVTEATTVNPAVAANNWQEGSPAADFRYGNSSNGAVNVIAEANKKEEEVKEKKAEALTEAEYQRRTELDVSDPKFINPDLGGHKVK